jgi:transcription elongation factor GreA
MRSLERLSWQRVPGLVGAEPRTGAKDAEGVYSNPLFITCCIFVTFRGIVCRVTNEVTGAKDKVSENIKQKLQKELDELDTELRVTLPQQIKTAKEWGDLRENAEYHAALARQQFVQARIRDLRQRISEVSSIDPSKVPHDKAAYGSTLVLYDAERDEEVTYRLVTPEESDPQGGLISTTSPVGRSLMGREEGDEVKVQTPAGSRNFEIRSLKTFHDQVREAAEEKPENSGG